MTTIRRRAAEWVAQQRLLHAAVDITYRRGDISAEMTAVVGSTRFEAEMEDGRIVETESRDYLVAPGDLVIEGVPIEPRPRDRIVETIAGKTCEFEVMAPAGQPVFAWIDPARLQMRIHTKQIEDEEQ
jgi:hypothetical protein